VSGYVPQTPYQVNPLLLMLMAQQQQRQQQGRQPQQGQTPGGGLSSIFSGGAGGGIGSLFGGGGGAAAGGGGVGETAGASGAGAVGEAAGMGAGPAALGAVALGGYLSNMYEGGGKDIIRGKGKSSDYTNLALDINPVTAPINMGLRLFGQKSIGKGLFGGHKGPSPEDLAKAEETKIAQGQWGNPDFARSRDEGMLKPQDVWGAKANTDLLGEDYLNKSNEAQRTAYQQKLLDAGLWREAHGGLSVTDPTKAKQIWDQTINGSIPKAPTMTGVPRSPQLLNGMQTSTQPLMIPQARSMTRSPGIDKNGRRISY
jgi:hypothetical protein